MKKLQILSGQAKLISLLFLMFLMSACGTLSTQVENTPSLHDRTPSRKDINQTMDGGKTWTKMSSVSWEGQFSFASQQLG